MSPKNAAPVYGEVDLDSIHQDWERQNSRKGRFAPKEPADFTLRILPPPPGYKQFLGRFGVHYDPFYVAKGTPPERRALLCLLLTDQQECPFDRAVESLFAQARSSGVEDRSLINIAAKVKAKTRYVFNVVDMDNVKAGVMTWEIGTEAFELLYPIIKRWGDISKPDWDAAKGEQRGQAISVTFSKKDRWTKVTNIQPTGENPPIEVKEWWNHLKGFNEYIDQYRASFEEMKAWLRATDDYVPTGAALARQAVEAAAAAERASEEGTAEVADVVERSEEDDSDGSSVLNDPEIQKILQRSRARR